MRRVFSLLIFVCLTITGRAETQFLPAKGWQEVGEVALDKNNPGKFTTTTGKGVMFSEGHADYLLTKENFGDVQVHVEFNVPKGSNAGVYFAGSYEVQILDSFGIENPSYPGNACGGIYPEWINNANVRGHNPLVNASKPPGEWQTFDVTFRAARFDSTGKKIANALFVKVVHNGKLVQENVEVLGPTRVGLPEKTSGPLRFQGDHGPVAYRNIQVHPLPTRPANYDEARVPKYTLPDPLADCPDAATWRNHRRAEILKLFQSQMYGYTPSVPAGIKCEVTSVDTNALGGKAVRKEITMHLFGLPVHLLLYLPANATNPVPVFVSPNFFGNHTVSTDPGITITQQWIWDDKTSSEKLVTPDETTRGKGMGRWPLEKILARGYAVATFSRADIEPDYPTGWKHGIRGAWLKQAGKTEFAPDDWCAIGAWAFGLSRALDYLETDKAIDAKRAIVIGHSRLGKTALWAGAQDERFAITISNNSGEGGAALARRCFGETTALINQAFPHWFCANFKRYNDREDALPFDQHELIALIAPRPVYIASAKEDRWADLHGEFLAGQAAEPVYRLLGKPGLGASEMPPVNQPVGQTIGYHIRTGGHDVKDYDWEQYLNFADRHLKNEHAADVVVYGGTSAGVVAAVQSTRMGKSVVLIEPSQHLGGLSSGGLGATDSGNKEVIGGISREFYQRIKKHYDSKEAGDAQWRFEPHVAEQVFREMITEAKVPVVYGERLDLTNGVMKTGTRITAIRMESGREFAGKMFIDATYEGDLMAKAGVAYTVGRESNAQYGETLNGVQTARATHHQFKRPVDPYVVPGNPASGLLPGIQTGAPGRDGDSDQRIQAYNFRMCLTDVPANRVAFPKPLGYDPLRYALLLRYLTPEWNDIFGNHQPMPNHKTDTNNNGAFGTDDIGMNYNYPDGDYATRAQIIKEHETYQKGLMWFLANDPRVPEPVRQRVNKWGLAKDEFTDNANWPHQLYIRESRRMISDYVHTEHDCRRTRVTPDSVGMGSYNMDSHNCRRYVDATGHVRNEGDVQVNPGSPYMIPYRSIRPKASECTNLLVPVCVSSSHIAYGSIRMEPVFMILGQSAATAACLALDANVSIQDVGIPALQAKLLEQKQVLTYPRNK